MTGDQLERQADRDDPHEGGLLKNAEQDADLEKLGN